MAPILTRIGQSFGFGASAGGDSPIKMEATGGTIIDQPGTANGHPDGDGVTYSLHVWTNPGNGLSPYGSNFVITSCTGPGIVQYLVVGGGGSGGLNNGGGGGAGGFRQGTYVVSSTGGNSNNGTYGIGIGTAGNSNRGPEAALLGGVQGGTSYFGPPSPDPNNPNGGLYAGGGGGGVSGNMPGPKAAECADVDSPPIGGSGGGGSRGIYPNPSASKAGVAGDYGYPGYTGDGGQGGGGGGASDPGGPPPGRYAGGDGSSNGWIPPSYGTPGPNPGRWFAGGGGGAREGENAISPGGWGGGGCGFTADPSNNGPTTGSVYRDYSPLTTPEAGIGGRGARSTGGGGGGEINGSMAQAIGGDGIVAIRYLYDAG